MPTVATVLFENVVNNMFSTETTVTSHFTRQNFISLKSFANKTFTCSCEFGNLFCLDGMPYQQAVIHNHDISYGNIMAFILSLMFLVIGFFFVPHRCLDRN